MKKKYAGYVNLKPLNGVIYPSSVQNIMMKNYVENDLKGIFHLAPTEFLQAKFSIVLRTLLSKQTSVEGIVMLSTFLLPKRSWLLESKYDLLKTPFFSSSLDKYIWLIAPNFFFIELIIIVEHSSILA